MNHNQTRVIFPNTQEIDLQPVMRQVYMWMGLGTLLTALVAFMTVNTSLINFALNPIAMIIAIIAELGMVFGLSLGIQRLSTGAATALFFAYAGLNGFTLSLILLTFNIGTIITAFLATAGLFGVMTVFAFTTSMDLTKMGTYMMMGVIGLIIAMVLNMFINSGPLDMLISMAGVLIFTALTAYDTQQIGQMATTMSAEGEAAIKFGIMGALKLYLDFINLFLFMVTFMGGNRRR
jgi:hypothetical protein